MSDFDPDKYLADKRAAFDPDAYLQGMGGGRTEGVASDIYKSVGTGAARGLAQGVGDVGEAIAGPFGPSQHFRNLMADLGLGKRPEPQPSYAERLQANLPQYKPQTGYGSAAERVGEFVGNPLSYVGATSPTGLALSGAQAATSALGSYGAEKLGDQFGVGVPASVLGAVLGGHAPNVAMKAITPNAIRDPLHAQDIDTLRNEGVTNLSAGDITGNRNLRASESEFSNGLDKTQKREFEQAAFNKVGEVIGGRRVTGPGGALETMKDRIGKTLDGLEARNAAEMDQQTMNDLQTLHSRIGTPGLLPKGAEDNINANIGRVLDVFNNQKGPWAVPYARASGQTISGENYATVRSDIRDLAMSEEHPKHSEALHQIANIMDSTMERSIAKNNPDDLGAWQKARDDYRASLVLKKWANSKDLTPAALKQADKQVYGADAHNLGQTPFADLSDAADRTIYPYQTSETARRSYIESLPRALAATGGALAGLHYGGAMGAGEGGTLGLLLGSEGVGGPVMRGALGKAVMSSPAQGYLGNQAIPQYAFDEESQPLSVRIGRALAQTQPISIRTSGQYQPQDQQ
jgi:hypothetical protein